MSSRFKCSNCDRSVIWLLDLSDRPIESDPSPVIPGDPGFVVVRSVGGRLRWVPTECAQDLGLPPPTEHLRIHQCLWQRSSGVNVDKLRVNTDEGLRGVS